MQPMIAVPAGTNKNECDSYCPSDAQVGHPGAEFESITSIF